eukprot:3934078-Rhodomonas_salina.1
MVGHFAHPLVQLPARERQQHRGRLLQRRRERVCSIRGHLLSILQRLQRRLLILCRHCSTFAEAVLVICPSSAPPPSVPWLPARVFGAMVYHRSSTPRP